MRVARECELRRAAGQTKGGQAVGRLCVCVCMCVSLVRSAGRHT